VFSVYSNRPRRRPSIGDRGSLLGWNEDEWRKQAVGVSLVPPEKRPRTKDDDEDEQDSDMALNSYPGLPWV
jgi:hypothetical protein